MNNPLVTRVEPPLDEVELVASQAMSKAMACVLSGKSEYAEEVPTPAQVRTYINRSMSGLMKTDREDDRSGQDILLQEIATMILYCLAR